MPIFTKKCMTMYARGQALGRWHTENYLINARGVYFILGVLGKALNRYEAFIRERRLFHSNRNNPTKQIRRVVCSRSKIENKVYE